jgi:hypothetical protein
LGRKRKKELAKTVMGGRIGGEETEEARKRLCIQRDTGWMEWKERARDCGREEGRDRERER